MLLAVRVRVVYLVDSFALSSLLLRIRHNTFAACSLRLIMRLHIVRLLFASAARELRLTRVCQI